MGRAIGLMLVSQLGAVFRMDRSRHYGIIAGGVTRINRDNCVHAESV